MSWAEQRLERIAEAHTEEVGLLGLTSGVCRECGFLWPCATYVSTTARTPPTRRLLVKKGGLAVTESWLTLRERVAELSHDCEPNDPELLAAKRDLAAHPTQQHIKRIVDNFPPLTPEQRARVAFLLTAARNGMTA